MKRQGTTISVYTFWTECRGQEWKERRKMPLENWNRTARRQNQWTEDTSPPTKTFQMIHTSSFSYRCHSKKSQVQTNKTFSLFLYSHLLALSTSLSLSFSLLHTRGYTFLFDHKKRKSVTARTKHTHTQANKQTQSPEAHVFVDSKVPAFSFYFMLALFR